MSDQAMQVPLVELLRGIPSALRGEWVTQWSEDGFETGHAMAPVGMYCHQAADRIAELEKVAENAVIVCNLTEDSSMIHQLLERPLKAAGYLGGGENE